MKVHLRRPTNYLILGSSLFISTFLMSCTTLEGFFTKEPKGLHELVESNDQVSLRRIYGFDVDSNVRDNLGRTPLHRAAEKNFTDIAALLLLRDAQVNAVDNEGNTPLHIAIIGGAREMTALLALRGADLFLPNKEGKSVLDLAYEGGTGTFESLINAQTILAKGLDGSTILHFGASKGDVNLVQVLVKSGAGINTIDSKGLTALDWALTEVQSLNHARVAQFLLESGSQDPHNQNFAYLSQLWPGNPKQTFDRGRNALHLASIHNHGGIAELLVSLGLPVNSLDNDGVSPLALAASGANPEVLGVLLRAGADVNTKDALENTPLHGAVLAQGAMNVLPQLLAAKADVNVRNKAQLSPLLLGISTKQGLPVIQALIAAQADVNARDGEGNTALLLGLRNGLREQSVALIQARANLFIKNSRGESPIGFGVQQGPSFLSWLITNSNKTTTDPQGEGILHYAVREGNFPASLDSLVKVHGLNPNGSNRAGQTPLHVAVQTQRPAMALVLIQNGGDLYQVDGAGRTPMDILLTQELSAVDPLLVKDVLEKRDALGQNPLFHGTRLGRLDLVRSMIAKGADLNARNNAGATALHHAVRHGQLSIAQEFIKAGIDPNTPDSTGNTSLHYVVQWSQLALADTIINAKVNIEAVNAGGRTAFHEAVRSGDYAMVVYLLNKQANPLTSDKEGRTPLFDAVALSDPKLAILLLDLGRQVAQRDRGGNTALHEAAKLPNRSINEALLSRGADLFAENAQGKTPVHNALAQGLPAVQALLSTRNINTVNNQGNSAMHMATEFVLAPAIIDYLLSLGPDPMLRNKLGKTALDLAREAGRAELQRKLEEALIRPAPRL